jgi:hypothetical protein
MSGLLSSLWSRVLHKRNKVATETITKEAVESTSTQFPFRALPDEMLVQIFSNLDRNGLLNARAVSSKWNGVILRNLRNTHEPLKVRRFSLEINSFFILGQSPNNYLH